MAPSSSTDPHTYFDPPAPSASIANGVPVPRAEAGDPNYSQIPPYGEVLPSRYQAYSPDPYTPNNHSRTSTSEASQSSQTSRPTTSSAGPIGSLFSNPGHKYLPINTRQHSSEAPSPYLPDFPAFSSSHTFTYPDIYPSRSASGSSGSAGAVSPISPDSTHRTSVTSQPQHAHATVMAANNRVRLANIDATKASSGHTSAVPRKVPAKKVTPTTRQAIELNFDCRFCGVPLAKLTLRGGGTTTSGRHEGTFYCAACVPLPTRSTATPPIAPPRPEEEEATYADTLSAAVDRLEGLSVEESDPRPPPATRGSGSSGGSALSVGKKRTKAEDDERESCMLGYQFFGQS